MYDKRLLDREWRLNNLYKIVDKFQHRKKFKKNTAQEYFDKNKHTRNIILKSRRLGFTTFEGIDMIDDALFSRNFSGLLIAHTKEDAIEIFDKKIEFPWLCINDQIKRLWKIDSSSANKLKFDFGDGTFSSVLVSNSGRSGIYNRVHLSEFGKLCAKYPMKANEVISGTIPTIPPDGRIDIESTAEGMGGHFYKMFWEAWNNKGELLPLQFKAFFFNWTWDKEEIGLIKHIIPVDEMDDGYKFIEYQLLHNLTDIEITYYYTKWLSLNKDWDTLNQEYPTTPEEAFIASGSPYFSIKRIQELLVNCIKPVTGNLYKNYGEYKFVEEDKGCLRVWEYPRKYLQYTIGGDTAEGIEGGDYQVLQVIDNSSLRNVATYVSRVSPDEFAEVAYMIGIWYNNAYIGIEANKDGLWVNTELFKLAYSNMYYREEFDDVAKAMKRKLGFKTDSRTRPLMLAELTKTLNTVNNCWTNERFLRECITFVRDRNGKPQAIAGEHDDEVMAYAIALMIRGNAKVEDVRPQEVLLTGRELTRRRLEMLYGKKSNNISQNDYI